MFLRACGVRAGTRRAGPPRPRRPRPARPAVCASVRSRPPPPSCSRAMATFASEWPAVSLSLVEGITEQLGCSHASIATTPISPSSAPSRAKPSTANTSTSPRCSRTRCSSPSRSRIASLAGAGTFNSPSSQPRHGSARTRAPTTGSSARPASRGRSGRTSRPRADRKARTRRRRARSHPRPVACRSRRARRRRAPPARPLRRSTPHDLRSDAHQTHARPRSEGIH
jgi:hypothetical protein